MSVHRRFISACATAKDANFLCADNEDYADLVSDLSSRLVHMSEGTVSQAAVQMI